MLILTRKHSESLHSGERSRSWGWISLLLSFVVYMRAVEMCSFCYLTSMELILITNCSLLYLHSNDMKFEKFILEKNYSYRYNCYIIFLNLF